MLDFSALQKTGVTIGKLCADLTPHDLRRLTNEMVDVMLDLIADCTDADVVFVPDDPEAEDQAAERPEDLTLPWTLGHVIVHTTASAEEAAFLAAELARGVTDRAERSRYEIPWRTIRTAEQCRHRLEESRRMRLASLDLWPDHPHLDNRFRYWGDGQTYGPVVRFVTGLLHDHSHLQQIAKTIEQSQKASQENT